MNYGLICNTIICLVVTILSIIVAYIIYRTKTKDKVDISFSVFWLLFALVWLFFGLSSLLVFLQIKLLNLILVYTYETILFLFFLPLSYYIVQKLTKNTKIITSWLSVYLVLIVISLCLLFQRGVIAVQQNFFETAFLLDEKIIHLFTILFAPLLILTIIYFIKILSTKKITDNIKKHELLTTIALLIMGINGFIDQTDLIVGWGALFIRLLIIISPLLVYFAYTDHNYQDKKKILI